MDLAISTPAFSLLWFLADPAALTTSDTAIRVGTELVFHCSFEMGDGGGGLGVAKTTYTMHRTGPLMNDELERVSDGDGYRSGPILPIVSGRQVSARCCRQCHSRPTSIVHFSLPAYQHGRGLKGDGHYVVRPCAAEFHDRSRGWDVATRSAPSSKGVRFASPSPFSITSLVLGRG